MSRFERVKQWAAFSRTWHVYDAKWQNPFQSAKVVTKYLEGKNKPVYHPFTDAGDHVVVINSKEVWLIPMEEWSRMTWCTQVSLLGREWQYRVYFHHTGYPAGHRVTHRPIMLASPHLVPPHLVPPHLLCSTRASGTGPCGSRPGKSTTGTQPSSCGRSAGNHEECPPSTPNPQAVYNNMAGDAFRKNNMARLHVYPGEEVA